ncbi:hypothetical protein [Listeria booriae]|uniref:hypothetical protein n=1 Tax=Listeria booriae TaxID=1552123 RepID=UPI00162637D8|nr:hypothetical protein [Listeria booriae]
MKMFLKWYLWLPFAIIINILSIYNFVMGLLGVFLFIFVCTPKLIYAITQKLNMASLQYPTSKWIGIAMNFLAIFLLVIGFTCNYLLESNIKGFLINNNQLSYAQQLAPFFSMFASITMLWATFVCILEATQDRKKIREGELN